jgi:hypothetical protein
MASSAVRALWFIGWERVISPIVMLAPGLGIRPRGDIG